MSCIQLIKKSLNIRFNFIFINYNRSWTSGPDPDIQTSVTSVRLPGFCFSVCRVPMTCITLLCTESTVVLRFKYVRSVFVCSELIIVTISFVSVGRANEFALHFQPVRRWPHAHLRTLFHRALGALDWRYCSLVVCNFYDFLDYLGPTVSLMVLIDQLCLLIDRLISGWNL